MTELFAPRGYYLWDLWLIRRHGCYHVFYLQAPRTAPAGVERHDLATVGHATSFDLVHWKEHGIALAAGPAGSWDDLCLWTGSVIEKDSRFYMLYTGRNRDAPHVQKIGLAISDDLYRWEKHRGNPVSSADPRWYDTLSIGRYPTEDWRDPYLYYNADDRTYYALITARDVATVPPYGGCVALATSPDLVNWECRPPLCAPGFYKEMECPQIVRNPLGSFLLFSTHAFNYSPVWAAQCGGTQTGAHVFAADEFLRDYRPIGNSVLLGTSSNCYGTKICQAPDGSDVALSWLFRTANEPDFAGRLELPRRVRLFRDRLEID
jgi:beta-fructofuranosidase